MSVNDNPIRNMAAFSLLSGVSRPTLSKYFNDPASVRASTRRQIEQALRQYDYRPNLFAVNLNKRKPRIVGMIVPDVTDPFYAKLTQLIEIGCNDSGHLLIVLSSHGDPESEARAVETLLSLNIAGAIITPLGMNPDTTLMNSLRARIPIVFLDARVDDASIFIGTDNFQSIGLIADYLCRTGAPPTFFELPLVNHNAVERREAYVRTMRRFGLKAESIAAPDPKVWCFEAIGYAQAVGVLDRAGAPTRTFLCANDRIATGVMAAVFERGLTVGRGGDVRIAGHDDQPQSRYMCPPLTTVAQDVEALSRRALDLLLEGIEGGDAEREAKQVRLEGRLVLRASA